MSARDQHETYHAQAERFETGSSLAAFPDDAVHRGPFEGGQWLDIWRQTMLPEGGELFLISVYRGTTALLGFLFMRSQKGGLRVLECAGVGVSDYNAPLAAPGWIAETHDGTAIRAVVLAALPEADLLHLERMAPEIAGKANPLFAHPKAIPSRQSGWSVALGEDWESYFARLSPSMREKLGKARRRFLRVEAASMTLATREDQAMRWLDRLDSLQSRRIRSKGLDYSLDEQSFRAFYRAIAAVGVPNGLIAMSAMEAEGEIRAVNFGLRHGDRFVYLRCANELEAWAPFALGIVICEFLMKELQKTGLKSFDFGMGDYGYKARFLSEAIPLHDLVLAQSWRGCLPAWSFRMRRRIGRSAFYQQFKAWRAGKQASGQTKQGSQKD